MHREFLRPPGASVLVTFAHKSPDLKPLKIYSEQMKYFNSIRTGIFIKSSLVFYEIWTDKGWNVDWSMFIIIAALEPDFFFDAYVYSSVLPRLVFYQLIAQRYINIRKTLISRWFKNHYKMRFLDEIPVRGQFPYPR